MKRLTILASAVVLLLILLAALVYTVVTNRPPALAGTYLEPPVEAADFELTSVDGTVRKSDFRGRFVVLFFGYTFCPDVCPTTLSRLRTAMDLLGPGAGEVQVVMVSVDPERDTPERVSSYAQAFNPGFIGVTGTPEEVAAVAADYGIFHAKAEGSPETGYLVDHTAAVMVLDRDGNTRMIWSFEITPEQVASDLEYLIEHV